MLLVGIPYSAAMRSALSRCPLTSAVTRDNLQEFLMAGMKCCMEMRPKPTMQYRTLGGSLCAWSLGTNCAPSPTAIRRLKSRRVNFMDTHLRTMSWERRQSANDAQRHQSTIFLELARERTFHSPHNPHRSLQPFSVSIFRAQANWHG